MARYPSLRHDQQKPVSRKQSTYQGLLIVGNGGIIENTHQAATNWHKDSWDIRDVIPFPRTPGNAEF